MKRRLAVLLIVAAASSASAVATPAAINPRELSATQPLAAVHKCSSRYRHAVIAGKHKCLGSGQFCAKRNESTYRRLGFTCKPGSDGRLRLRRR